MTTLNVFWDDALVGQLSPGSGRDMAFRYADAYRATPGARPISLSLPLQAEPFTGALPAAWFANLLPEGSIRGHVARALGVSERNEFAILERIGGDCAGALRLLPDADPVDEPGGLTPLPWAELEAKIAAVPRPSLLALMVGEGGLRLSLAGAQDKLPVHCEDGVLALPRGRQASTHLLKIDSGIFPGLVQNELFCLDLAREVGLPAAAAQVAPTPTPMLLIERYDRRRQADGTIERLHQEDFCQALGLPPEVKYQNEGGPSLAALFAVLARGSRTPLPDKRDLLKLVFYNFIIGNADAHAKNVSFVWGGGGPRLAPFYDLVCTAAYESLAKKQAQKLGGEYRPANIASRHWDRFAAEIGVRPNYLRQVGLGLAEQVEMNAGAVAAGIDQAHGGGGILERVMRVVWQRLGWLRAGLNGAAGNS